MPEAEAEITEGIFIEYSGAAYAFIKLTKYIMLFILPAFLVSILMSGMQIGWDSYSLGSSENSCNCFASYAYTEH